MSKTILCILLAVLTVTFSAIDAKATGPNDTVLRYFQALQQGDTQTIKDSITGDMSKDIKVILEQNASYPEYLKNVYKGAEFQIKKADIQDNDAVITVKVNFPDRQKEFVLLLKKDDSGIWKIFKEISDQ